MPSRRPARTRTRTDPDAASGYPDAYRDGTPRPDRDAGRGVRVTRTAPGRRPGSPDDLAERGQLFWRAKRGA